MCIRDSTSGVIQDTYGNQVASGLNVTVGASLGSIVGSLTRQIDGTGRISFDLRSSTNTGTSTVTMTSAAPGTASGTINIAFAPKPVLTCNNSPSPAIVVPGQDVAFSVQANNGTATAVNLTTATTFTFSDGTRDYSANLAAPLFFLIRRTPRSALGRSSAASDVYAGQH